MEDDGGRCNAVPINSSSSAMKRKKGRSVMGIKVGLLSLLFAQKELHVPRKN